MEMIGTVVVYIIMACAIAGAVASAIKPESELGQQFVVGVDSIGPIFLPVAGIIVFWRGAWRGMRLVSPCDGRRFSWPVLDDAGPVIGCSAGFPGRSRVVRYFPSTARRAWVAWL